jgi:hypothetical protein
MLIRVATSLDTLEERPSSWPAPPAGFSKTQVLGPESDLQPNGKHNKKKKNKRSRESGNDEVSSHGTSKTGGDEGKSDSISANSEHPLLSRGLKSGRGGFSMEALEAERAKKRAKATADTV